MSVVMMSNRDLLFRLIVDIGDGDQEWIQKTGTLVIQWIARGDGVAFYRAQAFDRSDFGRYQIVSFGSAEAQLETPEPPQQLPDIGNAINWPYRLAAVYGPEVKP